MSTLPYQQRDEFDQELYRRPFSHNARKLMQLIYSAANGSPGHGIQGQFTKVPEPMYVMIAPDQATIAKECYLTSDTEVRRVCREL